MKYIKIQNDVLFGQNVLKKEDLMGVQEGRYDTIINTEDNTFFDLRENEWVKIPSNPQ